MLSEIVSGGQTGVDRAALDVAIELGISHGGWCPRGRLAEDGVIPSRYGLTETKSSKYHVRTEQNVIDSDATLVIARGPLTGGTELTVRMATKHEKPYLVVDMEKEPPAETVISWLQASGIQKLNVAGPRESTSPGIGELAQRFLTILLKTTDRSSD